MSKAESIQSFVDAIKESGISISDEKLLVSRLTSACEHGSDLGADLGVALAKVAINSKASGISFYADEKNDATALINTFKKYNLDGYAFRDFISGIKPLA